MGGHEVPGIFAERRGKVFGKQDLKSGVSLEKLRDGASRGF